MKDTAGSIGLVGFWAILAGLVVCVGYTGIKLTHKYKETAPARQYSAWVNDCAKSGLRFIGTIDGQPECRE